MKKFLALAVALLGLTAAQAVTVAWTTGTNEEYSGVAINNVASGKPCASGSFVMNVTLNAIVNNTWGPIKFAQWDAGNVWAQIWSDGTLGYAGVDNKFTAETGEGADRTYNFVMTYENTGDAVIAKGYIDTTLLFEKVYDGQPGAPIVNGLNIQTYAHTEDYTINGTVMYNGVLSSRDIEWLANNNAALVPEPTALALLALGVAGVVIRRRRA